MSEDYIARLMAEKALKNGGGGSHSISILKEVIPSAVTSSNGDISLKEYFSEKNYCTCSMVTKFYDFIW